MKVVPVIVLSILIFLLSCDDKIVFVKCPDCVLVEPDNAMLEIRLDEPSVGTATLINVYEGNIEDSILYDTKNYFGTNASIEVTLNKKYTVTATYITGKTYVAIDEATPRVRFEKNQCDDPCYYIYDTEVDLRLKYTK